MKQIDFDRAFPQTPDCIHTAIELGLRKGKNKMKFRNKIIAMGSIAAALAVMLAAALALGIDRAPQPDVLAQPPLESTLLTEDIIVYANNLDSTGVYHVSRDCQYLLESNMREMPEREAVALGLNPCGLCISISCPGHDHNEIDFVYYAQGTKYFHKQQECSGGTMPLKAAYADLIAQYPDKQPCPVCLPEGIVLCLHGRTFLIEPEPTEMPELAETKAEPQAEEYVPAAEKKNAPAAEVALTQTNADVVYVEYGAESNCHHRLQHCGGRENMTAIPVKQAELENFPPCNACCFDFIYYNTNGTYYHSNEHCQGMMGAKTHTRKDARRDGKFPCPLCLNVYCTESGKYFHLLPDCIGMMGAELRSLEEAYALGKTRCPVCLSPKTVYCTPKGAYFHAVQDCSGMEGASPTDPENAWNMDKDPCPVCITGIIHQPLAEEARS